MKKQLLFAFLFNCTLFNCTLFNSDFINASEIAPAVEMTHSLETKKENSVNSFEFFININTATAEELAIALKGVGTKKAQAIINYREQFGPFKKIDDFILVKGIGTKLLESNRHIISIETKKENN